MGRGVGFCTSIDLRNLLHPVPTRSVSSATRNPSLMASWVRLEAGFASVPCLIARLRWVQSRTLCAGMHYLLVWPRPQYLTPATQCIRQWRNPNNKTDDAETTNISCPYCRVPSYFVTPSSQFFPKDHPRRNEIVAQFKASMARVPCK